MIIFLWIIENMPKDYTHNADPTQEKLFKFYHVPRLDALKVLKVHPMYIRQDFNTRKDL